ncbi:MAG: DUF1801 domain-containing protein [Bacteroidia bacterium]
MAKANKTTETKESVAEFLKTIKDERKKKDCLSLVNLISKHTKMKPKMWGSAIVGFGSYHYKYDSGREGDAPLVGLSPRANAITLYLSNVKSKADLLKKLGKHKLGGGCVYVQKLEDINEDVLKKLVDHSIAYLKDLYPD